MGTGGTRPGLTCSETIPDRRGHPARSVRWAGSDRRLSFWSGDEQEAAVMRDPAYPRCINYFGQRVLIEVNEYDRPTLTGRRK